MRHSTGVLLQGSLLLEEVGGKTKCGFGVVELVLVLSCNYSLCVYACVCASCLLLLFQYFGCFPPSDQPPEFANSQLTVDILQNMTAVLECSAQSTGPTSYSWFRDGILVTSTPKITVDLTMNTLTLSDSQNSDAGIYICQAVNLFGHSQQTWELVVLGKRGVREKYTNLNHQHTMRLTLLKAKHGCGHWTNKTLCIGCVMFILSQTAFLID